MVFTVVVESLFDHSQPTRPWSQVFVVRPSLPIRENWKYRLLVNLVWFARNYLNFVLLLVFAVAWWFPGFLLTVGSTMFIHSETSRHNPAVRRTMRLLVLLSLTFNTYRYGFWPGFLFSMGVSTLIMLHAVFTPYTDERVARYHEFTGNCVNLTASVKEKFAPRTPIMTYAGTGTFPDVEPPSDFDDSSRRVQSY
jgi:hypothetical protein